MNTDLSTVLFFPSSKHTTEGRRQRRRESGTAGGGEHGCSHRHPCGTVTGTERHFFTGKHLKKPSSHAQEGERGEREREHLIYIFMNTYFWWTNRRTGGETGEHQNKHKNRLLVTANSTSPGRTPNMKTSLLSRIYTIYTTDTVRLTPSTVMNRNTYNIVIFTYSTRPVQNFVLIFKIFICICCDKIFLHIHRPLRDSCTVHLTLNCNMITLIFLLNTWVFIYNIFIC